MSSKEVIAMFMVIVIAVMTTTIAVISIVTTIK